MARSAPPYREGRDGAPPPSDSLRRSRPDLREAATASPKVRGPDGAAPLPIDTKGAAAPWREALLLIDGRDGAPPPSYSLRRSRPDLREAATASPEVRGPDGAAPLPIDTKGAASPWREALLLIEGRDGAPPPSDSLRRSPGPFKFKCAIRRRQCGGCL